MLNTYTHHDHMWNAHMPKRRHPGGTQGDLESTREAPRRHPGGTQEPPEASQRQPEAPRRQPEDKRGLAGEMCQQEMCFSAVRGEVMVLAEGGEAEHHQVRSMRTKVRERKKQKGPQSRQPFSKTSHQNTYRSICLGDVHI